MIASEKSGEKTCAKKTQLERSSKLQTESFLTKTQGVALRVSKVHRWPQRASRPRQSSSTRTWCFDECSMNVGSFWELMNIDEHTVEGPMWLVVREVT